MNILSHPRSASILAALTLAALTLVSGHSAEPSFAGPLVAATAIEAPPRQEASGLAASHRSKDILWTHDDSGGSPVVYAIDLNGRRRGAVRISGVKNEDWEDLASFQRDGKPWLLIADTGDNDAKRDTVRVHVLEEPDPSALNPAGEIEVAPAYTLRLRYEDGSRDCEGVAVDAAEGSIYLLTKRDSPPRLYRAPLGASREKHVVARFVAKLADLGGSSPIDALFKHVAGKRAAWPTSFDVSPDGRMAVVLTYGAAVVFARQPKEAWSDAFKREPVRLVFHGLPQAEGVCFSGDGRAIYVISESSTALVRYNRD